MHARPNYFVLLLSKCRPKPQTEPITVPFCHHLPNNCPSLSSMDYVTIVIDMSCEKCYVTILELNVLAVGHIHLQLYGLPTTPVQ